jgi:hypothetical protein
MTTDAESGLENLPSNIQSIYLEIKFAMKIKTIGAFKPITYQLLLK